MQGNFMFFILGIQICWWSWEKNIKLWSFSSYNYELSDNYVYLYDAYLSMFIDKVVQKIYKQSVEYE